MKNLELSHSCVILVTLAVNFCWKKSIQQQSRLGAGKEKDSVCSLYPFYRRITFAMTNAQSATENWTSMSQVSRRMVYFAFEEQHTVESRFFYPWSFRASW